jgi:phosphoribosylglycinamide formyltransferase 1
MKICLLTYDTAHKKTIEVFHGLNNLQKYDISFLEVPFFPRPERKVLFRHRPQQFEGLKTRQIAEAYKFPFIHYDNRETALANNDYLIVCGANILEEKFAKSGKIINGHAGLIPSVRGLDSFKWAITDMKPIGNTLHIIDEEADSGQVLSHLRTPLYSNDDLSSFAARHYQNEIWLLTNFEWFLKNRNVLNLETTAPRKRMSMQREKVMVAQFESYKRKYAMQ